MVFLFILREYCYTFAMNSPRDLSNKLDNTSTIKDEAGIVISSLTGDSGTREHTLGERRQKVVQSYKHKPQFMI